MHKYIPCNHAQAMHILRGIKLERFSARARHKQWHESTFRKLCLFFEPLAQQNVPLKDPFSSEKHLQDSNNSTPSCQCFSPKAESRSASRRRAWMAPVQVSEAGRQATDQTTLTPPRRSVASPPPARPPPLPARRRHTGGGRGVPV